MLNVLKETAACARKPACGPLKAAVRKSEKFDKAFQYDAQGIGL